MKCLESILVYGVSNSGKTTQVQELGKWVNRKLQKKVRLVSCSGGGWTSIMPAIKAGIVVPTFIRERAYPLNTLDKMTRGWWPENPDDPLSPLLPPEKQKDWNDVGGVVFDSLTESATWMMNNLANREARGDIKISQLSIKFRDGDTDYGSPALAHYGNVQNRFEELVAASKCLGGKYVMWTALELKSTDDNSRLPLYGPDIVGKAKTAQCGAWFDNTLHLYITGAGGMKKGPAIHRMYLTTHFEDDGIPYIAKNRGHYYFPLPEYLEGKEASVYKFLELLQDSHEKATKVFMSEIKEDNRQVDYSKPLTEKDKK